MALSCYSCGKGTLSGNLVSHAKNRSKRIFRPNLHTHWITVKNKQVKAKFCAKCMRRAKTFEKSQVKPQIAI